MASSGPVDVRGSKIEGYPARRDSDEAIHDPSPRTAPRDRHPGLGMAFESGIPGQSERDPDPRRRMSMDDARKEEYWRGYYDSKRKDKEREHDRESAYHPDYPRRAQRYLEYDEERASARPYRSESVRMSRAPPPPPTQYRGESRYIDMPPRRVVDDESEDHDGMYLARDARRGGPPDEPPRRPSLGSSEYRIPFTAWMNTTVKGHFVAAIGEFVGTTMFLFFAFAGTQVSRFIESYMEKLADTLSGCECWWSECKRLDDRASNRFQP